MIKPIHVALLLFATLFPFMAVAKAKILYVASEEEDSLAVLEIVCSPQPESDFECAMTGTFITTNPKKLHGFDALLQVRDPANDSGNSSHKCFVEVGHSTQRYRLSAVETLTFREGPGGSCGTTVSGVIDFAARTYEFRSHAADRSGPLCEPQRDDAHQYTFAAFDASSHTIRCSTLEALPTLWIP